MVILNSESTDWSMIVEHVIAKRVPSNRASFCMGSVDKVMVGSGTVKTYNYYYTVSFVTEKQIIENRLNNIE